MKFIFYTILALIAIAVLAFLWAVFSGIYKWATGKITKEDRKRMLEQHAREKTAKKAKKNSGSLHFLSYPSPLNNWGLWH